MKLIAACVPYSSRVSWRARIIRQEAITQKNISLVSRLYARGLSDEMREVAAIPPPDKELIGTYEMTPRYGADDESDVYYDLRQGYHGGNTRYTNIRFPDDYEYDGSAIELFVSGSSICLIPNMYVFKRLQDMYGIRDRKIIPFHAFLEPYGVPHLAFHSIMIRFSNHNIQTHLLYDVHASFQIGHELRNTYIVGSSYRVYGNIFRATKIFITCPTLKTFGIVRRYDDSDVLRYEFYDGEDTHEIDLGPCGIRNDDYYIHTKVASLFGDARIQITYVYMNTAIYSEGMMGFRYAL